MCFPRRLLTNRCRGSLPDAFEVRPRTTSEKGGPVAHAGKAHRCSEGSCSLRTRVEQLTAGSRPMSAKVNGGLTPDPGLQMAAAGCESFEGPAGLSEPHLGAPALPAPTAMLDRGGHHRRLLVSRRSMGLTGMAYALGRPRSTIYGVLKRERISRLSFHRPADRTVVRYERARPGELLPYGHHASWAGSGPAS